MRSTIWSSAAIVLVLVCGWTAAPRRAFAAEPIDARLQSLERTIDADPENLEVAAEYRALAIGSARFDRSIAFFERITRRRGAGPNAFISLALAYVDKVPAAGDIRRLYLGRDAMNALSKSIAQRPCVFAFYMRGVINLYYNRFIFNRTDKGIADLTHALAIAPPDTPPLLIARAWTALGDGYHKMGDQAKAREIWSKASAMFPDDARLRERLARHGQELDWTVGASLAAEKRVDTTLNGLLPIR